MLFLNILILISGFNFSSINSKHSQFIKFEYVGETVKPIPSIIFYNSASIDSILLSKEENSIKITQHELDLIKEIVSNKIVRDSSISTGFYQFTIVSKETRNKLVTAKKDVVAQIFVEIINRLPKDERREETINFWNSISSRL